MHPVATVPEKLADANARCEVKADRIRALDGLRGIAALNVVALHVISAIPGFDLAVEHLRDPDPTMAALEASPVRLLWAGHEAVILFFVISGFVLTLQLESAQRNRHAYLIYLIRRLVRLYLPFLAIMLTAFAIASFARNEVPEFSNWLQAQWQLPPSTGDLLAIVFLTRDSVDVVNAPAWSLVHELRISLFFPLLLVLAQRLKWPGAAAAATLLVMCGAVGLVGVTDKHSSLGSVLRTLEYAGLFVAGACLAVQRTHLAELWHSRIRRIAWPVLGLGLLLYASTYNIIYIGLGAALLIVVALHHPPAVRLLESAIPQWLGRVSYSLYLSHVVVLQVLAHTIGLLAPWTAIVFTPLVALAVAQVLRHTLEVPSQRLGHRLTHKLEARRMSQPPAYSYLTPA